VATVVATVLFTDLVESTATASRLSAEAADELRLTHFGLLRGAIQSTGGEEVKNLGDGLMVSFTSPSRALTCAVAMQQAIEQHNRRAAEPLSVRIGVSAGEVTEEDGDYFGDPVVEAARLCAAARGGQILATDIVRGMVGRHATQSFSVIGELELKGLPVPVEAVEVIWAPETAPGTVPLPARFMSAASDGVFGFFGRAEEFSQLDDAMKRASTGAGAQTVLIAGEAGIGKTALVAQAARAVHEHGGIVLLGRCTEDLVVPYQPWIEALSHLVEHSPEVLERVSGSHRRALARLVPSLDATPASGDAETERIVLLEAIIGLLRATGEESPVLLVLDDMHWTDAATVQVLRHVVGAGANLSVLIACTYRDTDLGRGHPMTGLLTDFHREPGVVRVKLGGLDDVELMDLVRAAAGHELDENGVALSHALRWETGGNPFFVGELLRHLYNAGSIVMNDEGRWVLTGPIEELDLPPSIRDVVGQRVERLGDETHRVLSLASVIGREFDVDLLATIADVDEDALLDLLEAATNAAIVTESPEVPCRFRFTHALIQHGLYQDLGAARRQRTHLRIAQELEGEEIAWATPAELARHWVAATRPADLDKALLYVEQAGAAALAALAPDDAVIWYRQALDIGDRRSLDDTRRARLLLGLGSALRQVGDAESRDVLLEAAAVAEQAGDTNVMVAAVLTNTRGAGTADVGDPERFAAVQRALDLMDDSDHATRARLLAAAVELADVRDAQLINELADRALDAAQRSGDDGALLVVLNVLHMTRGDPSGLEAQLADAQRAVAIADRLGDVISRAAARQNLHQTLLQLGDLEDADTVLDEITALAGETRVGYIRWVNSMTRACRALLAGDADESERLAAEALDIGTRAGVAEALPVYGGQLFEIRHCQGRMEEIVDFFAPIVADTPGIPILEISLAYAYCLLDRFDEARPLLAPMVETRFANLPYSQWMVGVTHAANVAIDVGDHDAAAVIYDLLAPYPDTVVYPMAVVVGAVARPLGRLDAMFGRHESADQHFARALEIHRRLRAPFWVARTEIDWAEALVERGVALADDRVGPMLARARTAAHEHGFAQLERRAVDLEARGAPA
jgi:class 3 adenylate cyclase/tetratricopeptide (TPR) repeat protein